MWWEQRESGVNLAPACAVCSHPWISSPLSLWQHRRLEVWPRLCVNMPCQLCALRASGQLRYHSLLLSLCPLFSHWTLLTALLNFIPEWQTEWSDLKAHWSSPHITAVSSTNTSQIKTFWFIHMLADIVLPDSVLWLCSHFCFCPSGFCPFTDIGSGSLQTCEQLSPANTHMGLIHHWHRYSCQWASILSFNHSFAANKFQQEDARAALNYSRWWIIPLKEIKS